MSAFLSNFMRMNYLKQSTISKKVSTNDEYYDILVRHMPNIISGFIQNPNIIIKPGIGQGFYADIPWICLLSNNLSISPSAQKGLYIVLLFNKTCDSVYLALSQGITNFKNMKINTYQRNLIIRRTVEYFQNELKDDFVKHHNFSFSPMNLGDYISQLAKGYIQTTIISKEFKLNSFNENDFVNSLLLLVDEYDQIIDSIGNKSYDDVIQLINPNDGIERIDEALENIDKVLKQNFVEMRDQKRKPIQVQKGSLRSKKYLSITAERITKKIDYIEQAKDNYQTGLKGEQIALEIERNRLLDLHLDPDLYIKWCSIESDNFGYDIESVDFIDGQLKKIYIEVKSTKDIVDTTFYVSKNELQVSKEKDKQYRVFRVFDITSMNPKYYYVDGQFEENFVIDPYTYTAKYKYQVLYDKKA